MKSVLARLVLVAFSAACALSLPPATASAQDEETQALREARRTFHQALELEQAKNWSAALKLFREVGEVKMTPQVRFHIALCEEKLGKLVAALGGYELALADADAVGGEFKAEVEAAIAKLRARIPKLVIERGEGAQAAMIELDGITLGASSIGVEVPTDPGPHTIIATAKGYEDFSDTIEVKEGGVETLEVTLKKLPAGAGVSAGSDGQGARGVAPARPKSNPVPPVIAFSVGGAALIGSGAFFMMRTNAISNAEQECGAPVSGKFNCVNEERMPYVNDQISNARTFTALSGVSLGVGIAGIGTGIALLVLKPFDKPAPEDKRTEKKPSKEAASVGFVPAAPNSELGASLVGRF